MAVPSGGTFEKSQTSSEFWFLIYIMGLIIVQLVQNVLLRLK